MDPLQFVTAARLLIVAGKGGVGKTTVTAAVARAVAREGRRVLAIELEGKPALRILLEEGATGGGSVEVMTITAATALAEYLEGHGFHRIVKRLVSSGIVEVVSTAAPGIDDIVVLGRLKQLERAGEYDLIVVDGPAAGQAIAFLLAPSALLGAVSGGPIREQATEAAEMLADPSRCRVLLVTLPETTPVNETLETAAALNDRIGVTIAGVVVNGVDEARPLPDDDDVAGQIRQRSQRSMLLDALTFRRQRRAVQAAEIERMSRALAVRQVHLPHLATPGVGPGEIDTLAAAVARRGAA